MGERARSRASFRTAAELHHYVSTKMPYPPPRAGSLAQEEYWAIVNFMLRVHGSKVPDEGVTSANAAEIFVEPSSAKGE